MLQALWWCYSPLHPPPNAYSCARSISRCSKNNRRKIRNRINWDCFLHFKFWMQSLFSSTKAGPWSGYSTPEAKGGQLFPLSSLWQLEYRSVTSHGQRDLSSRDSESGGKDSKMQNYLSVNLKYQWQNCESAAQQLVSKHRGNHSFLSVLVPW